MISFKGLKFAKEKKEATDEAKKPSATDTLKAENIFGQSLSAGQVKKTDKQKYIESKKRKKAYIMLGTSGIALAAYAFFFFVGNVVDYVKAPAEIRNLNAEIQEYSEVIIPSLEKTRDLHKAAYDQEFDEIISALDNVFPDEIDKLGIVSLFESFATEVAAAFPPFEFTSINLSAPQQKDGYLIIPVSTSIHSSLAGFDKFLSLVDASGYIYGSDGQLLSKKIRLMSISNISVKYRGVDEQTGKDAGVDFSVKLNIYSRSETES